MEPQLGKKKWRLEVISPNSKGAWQVVEEFDDDELPLYSEQVNLMVQVKGVWESRIVSNE